MITLLFFFSHYLPHILSVRSDIDITSNGLFHVANPYFGSTCTGTLDASNIVYCPAGTYVYGFLLTTATSYGVLNIGLDCRYPIESTVTPGTWDASTRQLVRYTNLGTFSTLTLTDTSYVYCSGLDFIRGYYLRMWCPNWSATPTGVCEVKMHCSVGGTDLASPVSHCATTASFTPYSHCTAGYVMCGYEMNYHAYVGGQYFGDIDIAYQCCRICQFTQGYYLSSFQCQLCDSSCKQCTGPGSTSCTACYSGYTLNSGSCSTSTVTTALSSEFFSTFTMDSSWTYSSSTSKTCGIYTMIGGYAALTPSSGWVKKSFSGLSGHSGVRVRFLFFKIGNFSITSQFNVFFDGVSVTSTNWGATGTDNSLYFHDDCGSGYNITNSYQYDVNSAHTASTLLIHLYFSSGTTGYWGFNRFEVSLLHCDVSCNTCSGMGANQCTSCFSNTYLSSSSTCDATCVAPYFMDSVNWKCVTQCSSPYYGVVATRACVLSCPDNYYKNDGDRVCYSTCPAGVYANPFDGYCDASCPNGMYPDSGTSMCLFCDFNCLTCSSGTTTCSSCTYSWLGVIPACSNPSYVQIKDNSIFPTTTVSEADVTASAFTFTNLLTAGHVSTCGTYKLVGGDTIFGYLTTMSKTYSSLSAHMYARLTFFFMKIGNWNNNNLLITLDSSTNLLTLPFASTDDTTAYKPCGSSSYTEALRRIDVYFPHSASSLTITLSTDLSAAGPSWGVFDLSLSIYLCDATCQTCSAFADATQCLTCASGLYLQATVGPNSCLATCPAGTYKQNSDYTCQPCSGSCLTCSAGTATDCLSCGGSTYLALPVGPAACQATCNLGYYASSSPNICNNCDGTCKGCSAAGSSSCTSCKTNTYLQSLVGPAACLATCPAHTYPDTTTNICQICDASCVNCQYPGTAVSCLSCGGSNYLALPVGPAACQANCNIGYYPSSSPNICNICDTTCKGCSAAGSSFCTSCKTNTYLQSLVGPAACLSTCPSHTYPDTITNICQTCDPSCLECANTGPNYCKTCYNNFLLLSYPGPSSCTSNCPSKFYFDSFSNDCLACDPACKDCSGPGTSACLSCNSGTYLQALIGPSSCLATCLTGKYPDTSTNICQLCSTPCASCTAYGDTNCLTCKSASTFLQSFPGPSSCLPTCPAGKYPDTLTLTCLNCDSTCATCSDPGSNNCLTCATNLLLQAAQGPALCLSACMTGFYSWYYNNTCLPCNETCLNCYNGDPDGCAMCAKGRFLLEPPGPSYCTLTCESGYYGDTMTRQCRVCSNTCVECVNGQASGCIECGFGYLLQPLTGRLYGTCVDLPSIIPSLKNTTNPLSYLLMFSKNYSEIYNQYSNRTNVFIDGVSNSSFRFTITQVEGTDTYIIDFINVTTSITGYPLMHVDLNAPSDLLANVSQKLTSYTLENNMKYYFYLDPGTMQQINTTTKVTNSFNDVTSNSFVANNLFSFWKAQVFQCMIAMDVIRFLCFFEVNYPENVLALFQTNLPIADMIPNKHVDVDANDGTLPDIFQKYNVSEYNLNNTGNALIEVLTFWVVGLTTLMMAKIFKRYNKRKLSRAFLILFQVVFVWSYSLSYFLSNYLSYTFFTCLSFRYMTLKSTTGILNMVYSLGLGFFIILLYPFMFLKIREIYSNKKVVPSSILDDEKSQLQSAKTRNSTNPSPPEAKDSVLEDPKVFDTKDQESNAETPFTPEKKVNEISPATYKKNKRKTVAFNKAEIVESSKFKFEMSSPLTRDETMFISNANLPNGSISNFTDPINKLESIRYSSFHKDFNSQKKIGKYFMLILLFKQFVYALIICVTFDSPFGGLAIANLFNFSYILFLIMASPFKEASELLQTLFNEMCGQISMGLALYMAYMDKLQILDDEFKLNLGWGIVICNLALIGVFLLRMLIGWILVMYALFKEIRKKFKKKFGSKVVDSSLEKTTEKEDLGILDKIMEMEAFLT